ncbi:ankyrin repeat-containing domain protein [Nemania serpens]|nr:ankyrin repeat-containing domain protein [Nemania serpens]
MTPLHIAAAEGHNDLVNLLLDNGAYINALSRLFCKCTILPEHWLAPLWTPLHTSICRGHESTTRLLLSRGASTNVTTRHRGSDKEKRRFTALHSACAVDSVDAARALVDGGHQTDVTVRDHNKLTPLAYAFFRGNCAMIDFLVEHGVDINVKIGPLNALGHACLLGYYAEALRLLDLGATSQCDYGANGEPPVYFHLIAVAGAPDFPSSRSTRQKEFRLELLNRLIKYGIDIDQQGNDGTAALMEAASFHRVDVVKALLYSGADVRAAVRRVFGIDIGALGKAIVSSSNEPQKTPRGAMLNTVRALLEAMGKTPAPRLQGSGLVGPGDDRSGTTDDFDIGNALRLVCSSPRKHEDKIEVVAALLRYSRAVEIANVGSDLVYESMLAANFDISDLLLKNGFNGPCERQFGHLIQKFLKQNIHEGLRHIVDRFPDTAPRILCDAVETGCVDCAELLIEKGVSINSRDRNRNSLLFAAFTLGDTDMVEMLLRNGADADEFTKNGESLKAVAASNIDSHMMKLLLDFGASIHSPPPGKPGKSPQHSDMGLLDIAISYGLPDAVRVIVGHKYYSAPTDEEISRHWQTVIYSPSWGFHQESILSTLLETKGFDTDQIFTMTIKQLDRVIVTTPLHFCAAVSLVDDKTPLIDVLIRAGADIHKHLPVGRISQTQTPKLEPGLGGAAGFEGTTPLKWAIEFSSINVVRTFLEETDMGHGPFLNPALVEDETTRLRLMLLYAKAACRRQHPKMFSLLFKKGLDRIICDEDGNTVMHMICDYVETFWPNGKPGWTMQHIAEHSAFSLVSCLKWGEMCLLRNKKGLSGTDRVLQILKYSGDCEFRQTLAKHWREIIDYTEGSDPRLTTSFVVSDYTGDDDDGFDYDSEEDEPAYDSGDDELSEDSDDDPIEATI